MQAYKENRRSRKWMLAAETAAHNAREFWALGDLELRTLNRTLNLALDNPRLTTQADRDAAGLQQLY